MGSLSTCAVGHFRTAFIFLTLVAVAGATEPLSGLALVRQELPELAAAFATEATTAEIETLFAHWTADDIEEFRLKNYGLYQTVADRAGIWSAGSVVSLRKDFDKSLSGTIGEVWGVAQIRHQNAPSLQVLHETRIRAGTEKGFLVDGLIYETRGDQITLHGLIESKMGVATYQPSQPLAFLANLQKGGIAFGGNNFPPEKIFLFHEGKKKSLSTANQETLQNFNVQLVTQGSKKIPNVTQLTFPLDAKRTQSSLTAFYAHISNLKGKELKEYLTFYRKIEKYRGRIQELGKLLGYQDVKFHALFQGSTIMPSDYKNSKITQEPVHRISVAILTGKMELPEEFKDLLDPKLFLDASDTEANAMRDEILKLRPQDPAAVNNRRKRIREMGEVLGRIGSSFYNLFNDGSVGPNDYSGSKTGQEPVHRISVAILTGKMELPKEFKGLLDPKLFLDASDTEANTMKGTILKRLPPANLRENVERVRYGFVWAAASVAS